MICSQLHSVLVRIELLIISANGDLLSDLWTVALF